MLAATFAVIVVLVFVLVVAFRFIRERCAQPISHTSIRNDNRRYYDNRTWRGGDTHLTQVDARQLHLHQGSASNGEVASHDYSAVLTPRQRAELAARESSPYPDAIPGEVIPAGRRWHP